MDDAYCRALDVGLPPTAGWGLGVDRLAMLLTGTKSIREMLLFPMLRPASEHSSGCRSEEKSGS